MSEKTSSSEASGRPPAAPGSGSAPVAAPGWTGFNNLVSGLAAAAALVSTGLNLWINQRLSGTETRAKTEGTSDKFLTYLHEDTSRPEAHDQMALAVLHVIGKASGSADGHSDPRWRAALPVKLALLHEQPATVAAMDPRLELVEQWLPVALVEEGNGTHLTALRALGAVCRRALRGEASGPDLPLARRRLAFADELRRRIGDRRNRPRDLAELMAAPDKGDALAPDRRLLNAPLGLGDLLKDLRNRGRTEAAPGTGDRNDADRAATLAFPTTALGDQFDGGGRLQFALQTGPKPLGGGENMLPASSETSDYRRPTDTPLLARANEVVTAVQNNAVQRRLRTAPGPDALGPLLEEVTHRGGGRGDADRKVRLGAAVALNRMRQPVALNEVQAATVVGLIGADDADTRTAAAEFLMKLEDAGGVPRCFEQLRAHFRGGVPDPQSAGSAVFNAAVVVAAWARNLPPGLHGEDPGVTLRQAARRTVEEWRTTLKEPDHRDDWPKTIAVLNELTDRLAAAR